MTGTTAERSSPATSNVTAVRGFLEKQYAGDMEGAFDAHAAPGFAWVVSSRDNAELTAAIPWAGRRHEGKDGYLELVGQLFGEFDPLVFEAEEFTDAGDKVFVQGHFRFRHRRTGQTADSDFLARFDMLDGRIAGGQFFENTFAVARARTEDCQP